MGNRMEDMNLGSQEGKLPLIEYEEGVYSCEDKGEKDGYLANDDDIPYAYGAYADMTVMDIPYNSNDKDYKPGNLNNDEEKDGRPPFGLFHGLLFIPLEDSWIKEEMEKMTAGCRSVI
jgi:hypothetical protein